MKMKATPSSKRVNKSQYTTVKGEVLTTFSFRVTDAELIRALREYQEEHGRGALSHLLNEGVREELARMKMIPAASDKKGL